jgi:hypothetical protein
MTDAPRYGCTVCGRSDLTITQTFKLRMHTPDGRRRSEDNPSCPGKEPVRPDQARVSEDPEDDCGCLDDDETADPCPTEDGGVHRYAFGECTCGAAQPGYVAPPEPVTARQTPGQAAAGFLMGAVDNGRARADLAEAQDVLMAEDPPDDGTDKLYKNGRYALPDPLTGNPRTWTRATTMAETVSDLYSLNLWRIRMVLIGLARNPYLLEDLIALDNYDHETGKGELSPKDHKDLLNKIGFKAQDLAGAKAPANWGTRMHSWIERLSRDEITVDDVEEDFRPGVAAWAAAMQEHDLSAVPHLIERRVTVPTYGTAGTLDQVDLNHRTRTIRLGNRTIRMKAGEYIIGDIKTGRDLDYAWGEIAIQMSLYAQGMRQGKVAVWDPEAGDGEGAWLWESAGVDPKSVRDDVGVVFHMPVQRDKGAPATCTMYWIDLAEGWKAVQLCDNVRDWRKIKGLNIPFAIAEVPTEVPAARPSVRAPSWSERFGSVTTKDQGRALVAEYLAAGGSRGPALDRLVRLARDHMATLAESTA